MQQNATDVSDIRKLRKSSIGRNLGFVLLLSVLFLFSILLIITSSVIKTQTTESYYEMAREIVNGRADEINKWIEVYKNDLKVYSNADVIKTGDDEQVISWLHDHQQLRCLRDDLGAEPVPGHRGAPEDPRGAGAHPREADPAPDHRGADL